MTRSFFADAAMYRSKGLVPRHLARTKALEVMVELHFG